MKINIAASHLYYHEPHLTGVHASRWNCWHMIHFGSWILQRGSWCALLQRWCATFRRCTVTVMMDTSVSNSPIRTYMDNRHKMRVSHDENRSDPKDLCSLGVVDLDLSLSPDAFGLRAFDSKKPLTRMLPGSFPCELRLMLPDSKIATDGRFGHRGGCPTVPNRTSRRSLSRVPRWRLAREGPFLAERSSSSLCSFGAGCALQNTTYPASDYASPSGEFGIPLNHPRFLEWVGVPESTGL